MSGCGQRLSASGLRGSGVTILFASVSLVLLSQHPAYGVPLTGRQHDEGPVLEVPSKQGAGAGKDHIFDPSNQMRDSHQVVQIPQQFLGCWQGEVSTGDLTMMEVFTHPIIGRWLTKHYELCFERTPVGDFKVTMTNSNVEKHAAVVDSHSSLEPIRASADSLALTGRLKMAELSMNMLGEINGPMGEVDERVRLEGHLDSAGEMHVQGHVDGYYEGRPWFIAAWRTNFRRASIP